MSIFSRAAKKMCKKLKILIDNPFVIKHYKDGDFHKDYERWLTASSMTNFMRDPSGDLPWEEDPSASHIAHIPDTNVRSSFMVLLL